MNKIWEIIKSIWRVVKTIVMDPIADYGAEFYAKLGDLIAAKCKDNEDAKKKAAPLVDQFIEVSRQVIVRSMDGEYTDEDRATVKEAAKKLIKDIGNL